MFPKKDRIVREHPELKSDILDNGSNMSTLNPISRRFVNPSTGLYTLSTPPTFRVNGPQDYPSIDQRVFIHRDGDVEVILVPTYISTDSKHIFNIFSALPDFPHDAVLNMCLPTDISSPEMISYPSELNPELRNHSLEVFAPSVTRDTIMEMFHRPGYEMYPSRRGMINAGQLLFGMSLQPKLPRRRWWVTLDNMMNRLEVSGVLPALLHRDPKAVNSLQLQLHALISGTMRPFTSDTIFQEFIDEPKDVSINFRSGEDLRRVEQFIDKEQKKILSQELQEVVVKHTVARTTALAAIQHLAAIRAKVHSHSVKAQQEIAHLEAQLADLKEEKEEKGAEVLSSGTSNSSPSDTIEEAKGMESVEREKSENGEESEENALPSFSTDPTLQAELTEALANVETTLQATEALEKDLIACQKALDNLREAAVKARRRVAKERDMKSRDKAGSPSSMYDKYGVKYTDVLHRETEIGMYFEEALLFCASLRQSVEHHKALCSKPEKQNQTELPSPPRRRIIAFIPENTVKYVRQAYDVINVLNEDDWYYLRYGYTAALRKKYFPREPSVDISFDKMAEKLTKDELLAPIKNINRLFTDITGPRLGPRSCESCVMSYSDAGHYVPKCISKAAKVKKGQLTEAKKALGVGIDDKIDNEVLQTTTAATTTTSTTSNTLKSTDGIEEENDGIDDESNESNPPTAGTRMQDPCTIYPKLTESQSRSLTRSRLRDSKIRETTRKFYEEAISKPLMRSPSPKDYHLALETGLSPAFHFNKELHEKSTLADRFIAIHMDFDGQDASNVRRLIKSYRDFKAKLRSWF